MAIMDYHVPIYRDIFQLNGFFRDPVLMLGYQDIMGESVPEDFRFKDVKDLLSTKGIKNISTVDLHDPRANKRFDLNRPIPSEEFGRYNLVMDLGTIEHVLDTRQCLESCLRMVRIGGLYFVVTCVNGHFKHGLHVFNPDLFFNVLRDNGFEILFSKYSTMKGDIIADPSIREDVLIWLVAKKLKETGDFISSQQAYWTTTYRRSFFPFRVAKGMVRRLKGKLSF